MEAKFKDRLVLKKHNFIVFGKIGGNTEEWDRIDKNGTI